jgi:dUTP pyrophosphatase
MTNADVIDLEIKKLDGSVLLPKYAHEGDAGLDLSANERVTLKPFERKLVSTGIAIAIPDGYAGLVIPRSGLAIKHGISIVNAPGLIDSGYRGELKVILVNLDPSEQFDIEIGDRIAQLMLVKIPLVTLVETDELPDSERGTGGFGSSGIHRKS